jgi:enoyl-CoA hydratase/carnithine racemase
MVDGITVREHGFVREIVLDRPEARNALCTPMAQALAAACQQVSEDRHARVVVLSAAGEKAFCVGADLKERAAFTADDLRRQRPITQAAYGGVMRLPQPVIAAVFGFALGGGCELALAADLIVADETAVFGLPEVSVGLVPGGGGTQLATRRLGVARAADLIFTARRVGIAEAQQLGLVDRRVPAGQARAAALALAQQVAGNSPIGLRNAKQALRTGWGLDLTAGLVVEDAAWRATAFSADRQEGIAAFNEKRPPVWPGESA